MLSGYSRGSREITAQSGNYGAVGIFKVQSGYCGTTRSVRYSRCSRIIHVGVVGRLRYDEIGKIF